MGSGTTLLRLVLDSHPNIAIPKETGFMRGYDALRFTPFKWSGRNWTGRLGWSKDEFDVLARDFYDTLFMRYATEHGKQRWGDKTPLHTWHIADMARLFPDAQFIGIVRHPSASVISNMRRFRLGLVKAAHHWHRYTKEIAFQASQLGDRFVLIRYEDFVLDPEPVMRELLEWLGEPWSEDVLQHHEVHSQRDSKVKIEGQSRADEPIDVSRVDKWTRTLGKKHQRWLKPRLARHAEFFGYAMDEPLPVAPLADAGGRLVRGSELDSRIDAFPDLDLRTPQEPPTYDQFYNRRKVILITREGYAHLTRPRGIRAVGVAITRRLPKPGRRPAVKAVRNLRAALGLTRRPRTFEKD